MVPRIDNNNLSKMKPIFILITFIASSLVTSLYARGLDDLINHYANLAMTEDSSFAGFDANRGKTCI